MRQCILTKDNRMQIAWIDVEKRHQGKFVDLKVDGSLNKDWRITKVSDISFPKEWIQDRSQDYKKMKQRTDI